MLLRENVYEKLRSDILSCRLAPGDDMREQELARRRERDRKRVYVFLTPKGRRLRDKLVPLAEEVNRIAVRDLSKNDIAITRTVLLTIIENTAQDEQAADMRMPSTRDLARVRIGRRKR